MSVVVCRKRDSSSGTVSQGITTRTDGEQRQINPAHLPLYLRIKFLDEWVVVQGGVVDRSEFC